MKSNTPVDALKLAVDIAGGQGPFATGLTAARGDAEPVSRARVWNWLNRDGKAPADLCPDIEVLTGVTCELLRPDVNWGVLRNTVKAVKTTPAGHQSSTGIQ